MNRRTLAAACVWVAVLTAPATAQRRQRMDDRTTISRVWVQAAGGFGVTQARGVGQQTAGESVLSAAVGILLVGTRGIQVDVVGAQRITDQTVNDIRRFAPTHDAIGLSYANLGSLRSPTPFTLGVAVYRPDGNRDRRDLGFNMSILDVIRTPVLPLIYGIRLRAIPNTSAGFVFGGDLSLGVRWQ